MTPRLQVEGLSKRYGDVVALDGVDLEVAAGAVCAVVGPNGCGKSTLLELVEGLRQADAGVISIDGSPYPARRPRGGLVGAQLQEESLPARVKVREALRFYATASGADYPSDLVQLLGLGPIAEKRFVSLSGGQKRRTLLALAAIGRPRLVLLDEPTAGLDPLGNEAVERLIERLSDQGAAVVLATHDLPQVERICDNALFLHQGTATMSGSVPHILAGLGASMVLELGLRGRHSAGGVRDLSGDDPAGRELLPNDLDQLGIVRSLRMGTTSLYFGADSLSTRLRDWDQYDSVVAAFGGEVQVRRVTLFDCYLLALPEGTLRNHREAIAGWGGGA